MEKTLFRFVKQVATLDQKYSAAGLAKVGFSKFGGLKTDSDVVQIMSSLLHLLSLRTLIVVLCQNFLTYIRTITNRRLGNVAVEVVSDRSSPEGVGTDARGTRV